MVSGSEGERGELDDDGQNCFGWERSAVRESEREGKVMAGRTVWLKERALLVGIV